MPTDPVISVMGEAILEVEPEIAVVWVTVLARDRDRRQAVDLLAERSRRVTQLIEGFGDAIEKVESAPVNVHPEFKDGKPRERVTAYVARAGVSVAVADFAVLAEFVTGLAGQEMTAVTGPDWQLRPDSPVHRQARLAAAKDAMQRAREYAEAFGGTITGLLEASDPGMLAQTQPRHTAFRAAALSARPVADDGAPEFDFAPGKQTVTAQIQARFVMTAPPWTSDA
jgi:uncharacterized protein